LAVGTVWPATAPPPFCVALPAPLVLLLLLPPLLLEPPLLPHPAARTAAAAIPSAIATGRLCPRILRLVMCPPLKGS